MMKFQMDYAWMCICIGKRGRYYHISTSTGYYKPTLLSANGTPINASKDLMLFLGRTHCLQSTFDIDLMYLQLSGSY